METECCPTHHNVLSQSHYTQPNKHKQRTKGRVLFVLTLTWFLLSWYQYLLSENGFGFCLRL